MWVEIDFLASLIQTNTHTRSYQYKLLMKRIWVQNIWLLSLLLYNSLVSCLLDVYIWKICVCTCCCCSLFVALKILLLHKMELKLQMPLLQEHDLNGMFFWKSFASLKTTKKYTIQNYFIGNSILHVWNSNDG